MYLARVVVRLKATVNDPQGQTIRGSLHQLGFSNVDGVRVGKHIVIRLDEDDEAKAAAKVEEMCDKLLANPIIEEYEFELERVEDGG